MKIELTDDEFRQIQEAVELAVEFSMPVVSEWDRFVRLQDTLLTKQIEVLGDE